MRRVMWLAINVGLLLTAVGLAKPPELPARADGDGRVPVYPDGEQYREPAVPESAPRPAPKTNRVETVWWPMMNLLLPPVDV
jgi:hypothetical protein